MTELRFEYDGERLRLEADVSPETAMRLMTALNRAMEQPPAEDESPRSGRMQQFILDWLAGRPDGARWREIADALNGAGMNAHPGAVHQLVKSGRLEADRSTFPAVYRRKM